MITDPVFRQAIERFRAVYADARQLARDDPSVVALATADTSGRPSVRMVNLRDVTDQGFVFFANRESGKGKQLASNPRAAMCCYWSALGDQVSIEGAVERLSDAAADRHWRSRSRASQLASWASKQSKPMRTRNALDKRYRTYRNMFEDRPVPRPEHWTGYLIVPDRIEFWRGDWRRLEERVSYTRTTERWEKRALNP